MKLTTKRNRWYFWRQLFSYMIPIVLIAWTVDVFISFMQCSSHPEYSAPCNVNWIIAIIYWILLIITIILAIISASKLRKVKKKIEEEFIEATTNSKKIEDDVEDLNEEKLKNVEKKVKPKKIIVKDNKTSTKKITTKKSANIDSKKKKN